MLPLPEAGQLEPADAVQVQLTPARVAANASATVAPLIADGPVEFEATIVYVTDWPANGGRLAVGLGDPEIGSSGDRGGVGGRVVARVSGR